MKSRQLARRHFLLAAATGGITAAAAVATQHSAQPVGKVRARGDREAAGYRLTDHIRRYYRTTRV